MTEHLTNVAIAFLVLGIMAWLTGISLLQSTFSPLWLSIAGLLAVGGPILLGFGVLSVFFAALLGDYFDERQDMDKKNIHQKASLRLRDRD